MPAGRKQEPRHLWYKLRQNATPFARAKPLPIRRYEAQSRGSLARIIQLSPQALRSALPIRPDARNRAPGRLSPNAPGIRRRSSLERRPERSKAPVSSDRSEDLASNHLHDGPDTQKVAAECVFLAPGRPCGGSSGTAGKARGGWSRRADRGNKSLRFSRFPCPSEAGPAVDISSFASRNGFVIRCRVRTRFSPYSSVAQR